MKAAAPRIGRRARLVLFVLLLALGALAWLNRGAVLAAWERATGGGSRASPELAARAEDKLAQLGETTEQVALTEDELQSLVVYRWGGFLPRDVVNPSVGVHDDRVTLEGGVATARFTEISELEEIVAILPDTTSLRAVTSFSPLDSAHVALEVHELGAAGIPIPNRFIPLILGRFRGASAPGLSPNALAVPLPAGIRGVYVRGDSVVFLASRAGGV